MRNLQELKRELKKEYPNLWRRLNSAFESIDELNGYLNGVIKDYKKYDQGSISFTISALKKRGYSFQEEYLLRAVGGF